MTVIPSTQPRPKSPPGSSITVCTRQRATETPQVPVDPRLSQMSQAVSQAESTQPYRRYSWSSSEVMLLLESYQKQINQGLSTPNHGIKERGHQAVTDELNAEGIMVTKKQAHPEAKPFQYRALEHAELCEAVFGLSVKAKGELAVGLRKEASAATHSTQEASQEASSQKSAADQERDRSIEEAEALFADNDASRPARGRPRRRPADDAETPQRRKKAKEHGGTMVKEGLDNVAEALIRSEEIAQDAGLDMKTALKILNSTYTDQLSDHALLRVVQAWAGEDRLATMFIGLNDNLKLQWLRSFEDNGSLDRRNTARSDERVISDENKDITSSSSTESDGSDGSDGDDTEMEL
ncbi:hypothetical protein DL769_009927 [Monosporascus sp. CRB-8-3]|nr:hypothetical protein DL769_009927 [Monosporascus sp. CRB-8-3]